MKSKTFYSLFFLSMVFVLIGTSSCKKTRSQPIKKPITIHPLSEYYSSTSYVYLFRVNNYSEPFEVGYSFTSSRAGIISELGILTPDSGNVYTVSLWDGVTKELLIQKNIMDSSASHFNYIDLTATNEFKVIYANYPYMIGVFSIPSRGPDLVTGHWSMYGLGKYYYGEQKVFPITDNHKIITFQQEYSSSYPEFPTNPDQYSPDATGLCDIGFSYVEPN